MENRNPLINSLLKNFLKDLTESAKPLTANNDLVYLAETLIEYLKGIYNAMPSNDIYEEVYFDEEDFIRKRLLTKYREKMVPFIKVSLKHYFAKDDFNKTQLFEKLKIGEPILNYEEYELYIGCIAVFLSEWLNRLLLLPENSNSSSDMGLKELSAPMEETEQKIKNSEFSRSRQALLFYYVLEIMGIDIRTDGSMAAFTHFGHALFAWPYSKMDNSELYKMMKKLPFLKPDNLLLKDLEFVKRQFELIDHLEGIALVQKEIDSIKKK